MRKTVRFCRFLQFLVGLLVIALQQFLNVGFTIKHLTANDEVRQGIRDAFDINVYTYLPLANHYQDEL